MTHYDILGVSPEAKDAEIKKAYHQMIIAFHPDKYQRDKQFGAKKTQEIIEAYKVLGNPATRKLYDDLLYSPGRNTSAATANQSSPSYSQKTESKGMIKHKVVFSILGILFVVFVLALFATIIINI